MSFNIGIENLENLIKEEEVVVTINLESVLFDLSEAMMVLADDESQLSACISNIADLDTALENMMELQNVIATDKVSAGLMALFNTDDALARQIGREIAPLTEDNIDAISAICVEGLGEKIKAGYEAVKKFLANLVQTVIEFIKGLFDASTRMAVACKKLEETTLKDVSKTDFKAFEDSKVTVFTAADFDGYLKAADTLGGMLSTTSSVKMKIEDYAAQVKIFGYTIADGKLKKEKDEFVPAKDKTLKEQGWAPVGVQKAMKGTIVALENSKKLQNFSKTYDQDIKTIIKSIDDLDKSKDDAAIKAAKEQIDIMRTNAVNVSVLIALYGKVVRTLGGQIITITSKIKPVEAA